MNAIGIASTPARIELQIAAFAPAQFLQSSKKCRDLDASLRIAFGNLNEHADPAHPVGLLRPRRERPRGYTVKRDEFPPPHGAYPKAKDHGLSIAGVGVGQRRASQ